MVFKILFGDIVMNWFRKESSYKKDSIIKNV